MSTSREKFHFLRQLHCQLILGLAVSLLLPLWSGDFLQLPLILRVVRTEDTTRLEVFWSDDEGEKTKYEANTYTVQVIGNQPGALLC